MEGGLLAPLTRTERAQMPAQHLQALRVASRELAAARAKKVKTDGD